MSKYVSSPIALQLYFNSGENGVIAPTVVDGITPVSYTHLTLPTIRLV